MTCAACVARVEKAIKSVEGVESCSVNLLTGDAFTEGGREDDILATVRHSGYGIERADAKKAASSNKEDYGTSEKKGLIARLLSSVILLCALMYISMWHVMWGFPLPSFPSRSPSAVALCELLLAGAVLVINQRFFISGTRAMLRRSPNMDTLVALGAGVSFAYSCYVLFSMIFAESAGEHATAHSMLHELYFESSAMIVTLITVGKLLESAAKGRTTDALRALNELAPKTAVVLKDGTETTIPIEELRAGDVFVVRPGGSVPADGVIIEGECAIDESALTGESIPVDKEAGDRVSASSINMSGRIFCRAVSVGEDTTLAQIIKTVTDAGATKAPIARLADKISGIFVPAVLCVSLVTLFAWLLISGDVTLAVERAISVLVISCPCALGLATPVAVMVGSGVGARHGVLFKTAAALECAGRIKIIALDKTGTVTEGVPRVTDVITSNGASEEELLSYAASLEAASEHPLARAIVSYCREKGIHEFPVTSFSARPGNGLEGTVKGVSTVGGKREFIEKFSTISKDTAELARRLSESGKTPLYFACDDRLLGIIAVADSVKTDSACAIREMKRMGLRVVMITGDNEQTANAVAELSGIDEVIAGVLPNEKADAVKRLQKGGRVAMVGDGINDSVALVTADLGIAIGAGVDIAVDSADVVLINSRLSDALSALKLGRATLRNIRENLFWAFIYNVCGIPLAAGALMALIPWRMSPMLGAAAMSLSSFCVVTNALRLNFAKIGVNTSKTASRGSISSVDSDLSCENTERETKTMTKTVKIEGMMCAHCEAHVKKALEALDGVTEVAASSKNGTAVIESTIELDGAAIKNAVEDAGYTYIG